MSRKAIIITLLFISWPLTNIHRIRNSMPDYVVKWFPFRPDIKIDLQWYLHDVGGILAYMCIFLAYCLQINRIDLCKNKDIKTMFYAICINQAIDLFHYLGWYCRSEIVLIMEVSVLAGAGIIMFFINDDDTDNKSLNNENK